MNQQATNEVRELLGELVVSPVSSDVKSIISNLEETLTALSIENENKINNFRRSISVDIIKLSDKLESEWQLNELNDNILSCEATCKTIKQKVVSVNENILSIKEELLKLQEIADSILSVDKSICKVYNFLTQDISEKINYIENCQRNIAVIKQNVDKNLQSINGLENKLSNKIDENFKQCIVETIRTVTDKTDSLSSDIDKLNTEIIKKISTEINEIRNMVHPYPELLSNTENKFLELVQLLSHNNDERYSEIKDNIDNLRTLFKDNQNNNQTNIQLIIKNNKLSFYTLLTLSIINSFGIIVLFLIYFLK